MDSFSVNPHPISRRNRGGFLSSVSASDESEKERDDSNAYHTTRSVKPSLSSEIAHMDSLRRIARRPIGCRFFSARTFDPPPYASRRRVVVTGLGMITPLGCGIETTWRRLVEGQCGIRALSPADLKMDSFDEATMMHTFEQLTSKVAAIVPCGNGQGQFDEQPWLQSKDHRAISKFIAYALCSTDEALRDAGWLPTESGKKERTRLRRLSPFFIPKILINMASGHVSMKYGFQGPNHAAVTACATGAHSIGDATRMIQFGDADVMVAGGTESSIDALSIAGFCRIGEGCGVMVLEELNHAIERGAKIYAEVRGYGMSGDAYHITQPHNDGKGAILAMTRALEQVLYT